MSKLAADSRAAAEFFAPHEPDRGEVNDPYLFDLLDELGYDGWVGCEVRPAGDTLAGLGWAHAYGIAPVQP